MSSAGIDAKAHVTMKPTIEKKGGAWCAFQIGDAE